MESFFSLTGSPAWQRPLAQHVQEIGLVLVLVRRPEQPVFAVYAVDVRKVTGDQLFGPQLLGKIQEHAELDLPVAQHVRVGRATLPVFRKEVLEHPLAVLP